jgi:hypothetical protein
MPCNESKETFPDQATALLVRNEMIGRWGIPFLIYKCLGGCMKWHVTTKRAGGRKSRAWNLIDTETGLIKYWEMVREAGHRPPVVKDVIVSEEYL